MPRRTSAARVIGGCARSTESGRRRATQTVLQHVATSAWAASSSTEVPHRRRWPTARRQMPYRIPEPIRPRKRQGPNPARGPPQIIQFEIARLLERERAEGPTKIVDDCGGIVLRRPRSPLRKA